MIDTWWHFRISECLFYCVLSTVTLSLCKHPQFLCNDNWLRIVATKNLTCSCTDHYDCVYKVVWWPIWSWRTLSPLTCANAKNILESCCLICLPYMYKKWLGMKSPWVIICQKNVRVTDVFKNPDQKGQVNVPSVTTGTEKRCPEKSFQSVETRDVPVISELDKIVCEY